MTHEHTMNPVVDVTAPVGPPPGHTKFLLMSCACGRCTVWPRENYKLADVEWQTAFAARLVGEGYWLDDEAP